jgi:hypothetical protein
MLNLVDKLISAAVKISKIEFINGFIWTSFGHTARNGSAPEEMFVGQEQYRTILVVIK